jgi:hypothetical protein
MYTAGRIESKRLRRKKKKKKAMRTKNKKEKEKKITKRITEPKPPLGKFQTRAISH